MARLYDVSALGSFIYRNSMLSESTVFLGDMAEISLAVPDLEESSQIFELLGFEEASPLRMPYASAAFSDGSVRISLHEAAFASPTLTFFDSDIEAIVPKLRKHGRAVQELQRESGVATAVSCRTPDNWRVVLTSQRPPTVEVESSSTCGRFDEIALPSSDLEPPLQFWSSLGFQPQSGNEAPYRYARLHDGTLPLGLHETSDFELPACIFRGADFKQSLNSLADTSAEVLRQSAHQAAIRLPGDLLLILSR